jgi:hypothetical protein
VLALFAFVVVAAMTSGEMLNDVDEDFVDIASPKAGISNFIQEKAGCNCAAATSAAYSKFKGDMKKITALKEKADSRANKAETESQKQAGIARRCLAAEQLLSGDAKARREKLRAHIKKEVSIVEQQYAAKAKQLAKQCSDKIAMARKDEAAKSGSRVDVAVKKEQMRMKKEIDQFAAQKAAFKLKSKRMKLRLKVELDNVQRKVSSAKKKQLQAEEALKKAQRTIKRLEAKMKREAALAKQKLDAVKAQLAAKVKECKSAAKATDIARKQAKKAGQQTAHAQLSAKAAETAEKVQVVKLKNKLGRAEAKEAAEGKTIRKDKVTIAKEKSLLHSAVRKDKRTAADLAKEKQKLTLAKDKAADKEKQDADKVSRLRAERDKQSKKARAEAVALAGAKAKAVAQQAKDAIAEGQTKGQLTVVLGKLKGDKATIGELRKEMVSLRKRKAGGKGIALKAKLVEQEVKASQKEASKELTRCRAKEKLQELKVQELRKRKDGYKARLNAKGKLMDKKVATGKTELKVCMARSVGYQKQIAACIGAEKALKREELSMQALTKLSKEKLASALRKRRKQLAICQAKSTGLERHLQDKMVLKTKLESTERVLKEWKTTGKALQGQVHRLTLQRNQEMLKQQRLAMKLSGAHKQLARAGIKVNGLTNEQKSLLAKKHSLMMAEHSIRAKDKVILAKEDQHLQVCRLKVRKLIGSLRVSALKLGALKVAYQAGKGKASRQISRVDVRLRKCEAKARLKIDLCRKKQHAAEALAGSARARLRACVKFRGKSELLMKHMATAEAKFQKEHKLLKIDEEKLRKTMQINQGLTTALADKQRKQKLASAQAKSMAKGLKICEHVAKSIETRYKGQLRKRNRSYSRLLKTWNKDKNKNKGLQICEKIAAATRVKASVCEAKLEGSKKQLAACIGAENLLKKEGVSLAALKKMTKKQLLKRLKVRRRQVATCRVQVATLNGHLLEGKRCAAKMEHIKSKFKGVAAYLKANANKWKKKDALEKLEQKKEGAQARAMARGLSRAERKISRREEEVKRLKAKDAADKAALQAKAKLLRSYKAAMRSKLRKIKKVLWTKAQGNNKVWLRKALRKCHAAEVGLHNKWVKCTHKSKMGLELCRRAGKVALTMEKNKCARIQTRGALAKRASKVALDMCKRTSKRLETRAALAARAGKVALNMCIDKKKQYKEKALACKTL